VQVGDRFPLKELGLPERQGPLVVYFYPKAGTPGCMLEAHDFRAPMHSHSYDEIVYVIDGEGTLHLGGQQTPIGPGSAMHLPPLVEQCLENTGKGSMRVLGVFHPSGDPASRAYEASE
jgi:mannose-6-phosphate isomerase-like protein (cupin superfamily)